MSGNNRPPQQAFIKERSITDAVLDIITIMRNQNIPSSLHWIVLLDQHKAFDRINHEFIIEVLRKMNFHTKFINVISSLFRSQTAYITDSNLISEPIRVEKESDRVIPYPPYFIFLPLIH